MKWDPGKMTTDFVLFFFIFPLLFYIVFFYSMTKVYFYEVKHGGSRMWLQTNKLTHVCLQARADDSGAPNICYVYIFPPLNYHFFSSSTASETRIFAESLSLAATKFCYKYNVRRLTCERSPTSVTLWRFDDIRLEVSGMSALADIVYSIRYVTMALGHRHLCDVVVRNRFHRLL